MKPFNLEAALAGARVITRNKQYVRILGAPPEMVTPLSKQRIVGIHVDEGKRWQIFTWQENGKFFGDECTSNSDLFMAPTKKTLYCVMYFDPAVRTMLRSFVSLQDREDWLEKRRKLYSNNKVIELFEKEYTEE